MNPECGGTFEAGRVGFFEIVSEDPLRKGVFAVQYEGRGFAVAKEPGENVVCHRHASRVRPSRAQVAAVGCVRSLKVEHVEGSFTNSINEKLGRFEITSRGEGPLLNDKPEILELAVGCGFCCIGLAKPCFLDEGKKVDSYIIHDRDYCAMRNCSIGAFFDGPHENPNDFSVRAVRERHCQTRARCRLSVWVFVLRGSEQNCVKAQKRGHRVEACGTQVLWCGVVDAFPSSRSVVGRGGEVRAALCVSLVNKHILGRFC